MKTFNSLNFLEKPSHFGTPQYLHNVTSYVSDNTQNRD